MLYRLYNVDQRVASFVFEKGVITDFFPEKRHLLPMQIRDASADGFTNWLRDRAINLEPALHRRLAYELTGSRDKTAIAIAMHLFSVADTFTCFADDEFVPRMDLCDPQKHACVSDFILSGGTAPIPEKGIITPNLCTDGRFPKTWKYENGEWWLYKIQSSMAARSEREISRVLMACGWNTADYQYDGRYRTRIRSKNFVGENEFFEPYASLKYMFDDRSDDELVIYENIASISKQFENDFRRILLADALFMNTDRHMRNYGVIRSSITGEILRMAPNFDNNQAHLSNPGGSYSSGMLHSFEKMYGLTKEDASDFQALLNECRNRAFLKNVFEAGTEFLLSRI